MINKGIIDYAYVFAFNISKEWSFIDPKCCRIPDDGSISTKLNSKQKEIRKEMISKMKKMSMEELLSYVNCSIPSNYPKIKADGISGRTMVEIYDFIDSFKSSRKIISTIDAIEKICKHQDSLMNGYNKEKAKFDQGLRKKPKLPKCRCAIIFDDSMQCNKLFANPKFFAFSTRFRHLNMWLYISTQNIMGIHPRTRGNANRKIIFKPDSSVAYENAVEYITGHKRDNEMFNLLCSLDSTKHEFLFCDDEEGIRKKMICSPYDIPKGSAHFSMSSQ